MKYVLLSEKFYKQYNANKYPEILHKPSRPYVVILVKIDDLIFAIPIRSHFKHHYGFITNVVTNAGLDYTKAVIISDIEYIDIKQRVTVTKQEMLNISNNKDIIINDFKVFLHNYKRKVRNNLPVPFLKYTALQYFHKELGLE